MMRKVKQVSKGVLITEPKKQSREIIKELYITCMSDKRMSMVGPAQHIKHQLYEKSEKITCVVGWVFKLSNETKLISWKSGLQI